MRFTKELDATYESIVRPVIQQVIKSVVKRTGMEQDFDVVYLGHSKQLPLEGSSVNDHTRDIKFSHGNTLEVEAVNEYSEESLSDYRPYRSQFTPIFYDREIGVGVSPLMAIRKVELSIKVKTTDYPTMRKWVDRVRTLAATGLRQSFHGVDYTYPVPPQMFAVLQHMWSLKYKDTQSPEWIDWSEYLERYTPQQLVLSSTLVGSHRSVMVHQQQIGIRGVYDIVPNPTMEKGESGDRWLCDFKYKFSFDQPTAVSIDYPVMVNNTIIDSQFRQGCDYNQPVQFYDLNRLMWGLSEFMPVRSSDYPYHGVHIPCFDDWVPPRVPKDTAAIYLAMIQVDVDDPTLVMNLADLGEDFKLSEWLSELLHHEYRWIKQPYDSPVSMVVYQDDRWFSPNIISVDSDLNVRTESGMDIKKRYHLRLSLLEDLSVLSERSLKRLKSRGESTYGLFCVLAPDLVEAIRKPLNGSYGDVDFWYNIRLMSKTMSMYKNGKTSRVRRVGAYTITVEDM